MPKLPRVLKLNKIRQRMVRWEVKGQGCPASPVRLDLVVRTVLGPAMACQVPSGGQQCSRRGWLGWAEWVAAHVRLAKAGSLSIIFSAVCRASCKRVVRLVLNCTR